MKRSNKRKAKNRVRSKNRGGSRLEQAYNKEYEEQQQRKQYTHTHVRNQGIKGINIPDDIMGKIYDQAVIELQLDTCISNMENIINTAISKYTSKSDYIHYIKNNLETFIKLEDAYTQLLTLLQFDKRKYIRIYNELSNTMRKSLIPRYQEYLTNLMYV